MREGPNARNFSTKQSPLNCSKLFNLLLISFKLFNSEHLLVEKFFAHLVLWARNLPW